jgi:hypothetical protein
VLATYLADSAKARRLRPDGTYELVKPDPGTEPLDSQRWLIEHRQVATLEPARHAEAAHLAMCAMRNVARMGDLP